MLGKANEGPALFNNYDCMVSGGYKPRFLRLQRATGFSSDTNVHPHIRAPHIAGSCITPQSAPDFISAIMSFVSLETSTDMNGCIVNRYANGDVNIYLHADFVGRGQM